MYASSTQPQPKPSPVQLSHNHYSVVSLCAHVNCHVLEPGTVNVLRQRETVHIHQLSCNHANFMFVLVSTVVHDCTYIYI